MRWVSRDERTELREKAEVFRNESITLQMPRGFSPLPLFLSIICFARLVGNKNENEGMQAEDQKQRHSPLSVPSTIAPFPSTTPFTNASTAFCLCSWETSSCSLPSWSWLEISAIHWSRACSFGCVRTKKLASSCTCSGKVNPGTMGTLSAMMMDRWME